MTYREEFKEVQREAWWSAPRVLLAVLFGLVVLYGIGFLATGGDLAIYSFWAPKQANAENRVFHQTQAYIDGKQTYIGRLCREEAAADGNQKAALASEIASEASTVDVSKLDASTQGCISQAKGY